jgi:hypothetical protein
MASGECSLAATFYFFSLLPGSVDMRSNLAASLANMGVYSEKKGAKRWPL